MKIKSFLLAGITLLAVGCTNKGVHDPLPSWNDTPIKEQIIDFVEVKAEQIPLEDRIAVFDMDGTIMCESPLWCEMAVAAQKMTDLLKENPDLEGNPAYKYSEILSKNPADTLVRNNWVVDGKNYLDTIILKSFEGVDNEEYIAYSKQYLESTPIYKYGIKYSESFYQPMLEMIEYLKSKKFDVYIVSGSKQGILWSILPQNVDLDRQHLIGTCQALKGTYIKDNKAIFTMHETILQPKNNMEGKPINIYNRLGKAPVLAFGNTIDDFGMFRLASTSKYPHLSVLINHDDAEREFEYEPYHGAPMVGWQDTLKVNGWLKADMSKEFKVLWKTK